MQGERQMKDWHEKDWHEKVKLKLVEALGRHIIPLLQVGHQTFRSGTRRQGDCEWI